MINVLIGQGETLLRGALAMLLNHQDGMTVTAESATREEVAAAARRQTPHIIVLHHALPGAIAMGELCRSLCERLPSSAVLLVADRQTCGTLWPELVELAPRVGMVAVDSTPSEFVAAVRNLAGGEPVLDPAVAVAAITAKPNPLTPREKEILDQARNGAPSNDIAARLHLSTGTVNNHLSRIIGKTGARSRMEAIHIAASSGWI